METVILKTDCTNIDDSVIKQASDILKSGGLVAFPTETVYGLGGNALDSTASHKIYAAKGRPSDNPLIVHIADVKSLYEIASDVPDSALKLADKFWPGPLTMILKKKSCVPDSITGGLDSVAIRMPNHPVALRLIKESGIYVAAPSANTSGRPSPTTAAHVSSDLMGKIDMIIDAGEGDIGIESTIVDLTEDVPTILRPGYITLEDIKNCLGKAVIDKGIIADNIAPKAPGMKYRHYAPKGTITIVNGTSQNVKSTINKMAESLKNQGKKVAVMALHDNVKDYDCDIVRDLGKEDAIIASHNLYAYLREFDEMGVEYIFSESIDDKNVGQAFMNRLKKAAGQNIINV